MDARPDDDADDASLGPDAPEPDVRPAPSDGTADDVDAGDRSGPAGSDDEVWASIVARLAQVDADDAPPARGARVVRRTAQGDAGHDDGRDVTRDHGTGDGPHGEPPWPDAPGTPAAAPVPVGRDWDGTSQYDDAEDTVDELEHFVPGDPGPVLGGDPLLTLAWSAAAGVPLFLLVVTVAWRDAPSLLVRAAVVVFLAAVAVLVWRMPHRREPSDDDDDNGAVV